MKRPAFLWYPSDWLSHPKIKRTSPGAQALWFNMLNWMHKGEPYGHLRIGGEVIHEGSLAEMQGWPLEDVTRWLKELEGREIFSRDSEGCIYSRRMVKDEELRQVRAAGGVKGGNPTFRKPSVPTSKVNPKVTTPSHRQVNLPTDNENEEEKGDVSSGEGGVGEGVRSAHAPKWEYALGWLKDAIKNGSDYTEEETKQAWLALDANGWMWGKNPIIQWKSALERRIGDDRDRKESNAKSNHGPRTSGKNHGTADKPLRSRHIMRPGDGSENQPTVKHYPGSEKLAARVAAMFPVAAKAHPDGGDAP